MSSGGGVAVPALRRSEPPPSLDVTLNRLAYGLQMLVATAGNVFPIMSPQIAEAFQLTDEEIGRGASFYLLGAMLSIAVAPQARWLGAKPFSVGGCMVVGVAFLLEAVAPRFVFTCAAVLLSGFGAGCLDVVNSPTVVALNPQNKVAAVSWLHSFYCVGVVLVGVVCTALLWLTSSWRWSIAALSLVSVALSAALLPRSYPSLVPPAPSSPTSDGTVPGGGPAETEKLSSLPSTESSSEIRWGAMLRQPILWGCAVSLFLAGAFQSASLGWLPLFSVRVLGFRASGIAPGGSVIGYAILMGAGRMLGGRYAHRFNALRLVSASGLLSGIALVLTVATAAWMPGLSLALYLSVGLTLSITWPMIIGSPSLVIPNGGAKMFSVLNFFGYTGGTIMPWLVGVVADRSSLNTAMLLCATSGGFLAVAALISAAWIPQVTAEISSPLQPHSLSSTSTQNVSVDTKSCEDFRSSACDEELK